VESDRIRRVGNSFPRVSVDYTRGWFVVRSQGRRSRAAASWAPPQRVSSGLRRALASSQRHVDRQNPTGPGPAVLWSRDAPPVTFTPTKAAGDSTTDHTGPAPVAQGREHRFPGRCALYRAHLPLCPGSVQVHREATAAAKRHAPRMTTVPLQLDRLLIAVPCPACGYQLEIQLLDAATQARRWCACCRARIRLVEPDGTVSGGLTDAEAAFRLLEQSLRNFGP
jgi:hypothetical protein